MRSSLTAAFIVGMISPAVAQTVDTKTVTATAETTPVKTLDVAADDPAIWRNPRNPSASLIIGTDKRAGIHVYDLKGQAISFTPSPRLNNVDLRDRVLLNGKRAVVVAASDRADEANAKMALFRLDTKARALVPLANLAVGPGEAYGMCLWTRKKDKALFGFVVLKDGRIDQLKIDLSAPVPTATKVRSMKLATQSEGCVVDDRTGILYVAEEDVGLWRFDAEPTASVDPVSIAKADGARLVIDAEGLAIAPKGRKGGYLIVSSQGDNGYAVYGLPGIDYIGRFRISDGPVDSTQETDGIELITGNFGRDYPKGLFVAQDGDNAPDAQNFKLVSWSKIVRALRLK